MYQAVYFDYKDNTYYLRDDTNGWTSFKYQPTYYKRVPSRTKTSLPILTGGWGEATKKFDKDDLSLLERDINKELVLLRDLYFQEDDAPPKWHNIVYLDIETEMGGALTKQFIQEAPMPLTSLALIDVTTKQKICLIIDKNGDLEEVNEDGKIIIPCLDERDLMYKFLEKWEELDPTIVVGYNSEFFDIPYLYYRMCRVIGTENAHKLSPIQKINIQDWNPNNVLVKLGGINHLDFMNLIKKYFMKDEPSYKLGTIGEKYVKLGKIEYEGNLNHLFKKDPKTFIEYNLRDVEILEALEAKLKFVDLTIMISHICSIPYDQINYNTVLNEGAILKYLKRNGIIAPNKPTTTNPARKIKEETYAGGYIKEPFPGLYHDVIDLDFTSLYPSIIKSLNLGVETLVGRIQVTSNYEQNMSLEKLKKMDPSEQIVIERLNKIKYILEEGETTIGELIEIIETNKYTISASGAMFRTDKKSVTSKILEEWFEKREYYRGLKKQAGKTEDWNNFKLYDLFQYAFKILQNAMYGTFAKNKWRFTDGYLICSCAITNTGQRLDKESIDFVNTYLNTEYKTNDDYVKIADTDSVYIELKNLINNDIVGEDRNKKILEIANNIQTKANENLISLSKNLFNLPENKYFQLKQEVIASSVLVTGKRRYGMFISNKEGVNIPPDHDDALDLKGLEIMKSNMNPIFKKFGENLIKEILFGKDKGEIDTSIIKFHKSLKKVDPRKLGKPTGVSFINKCIKRKPSPGEIFSELNINTKENSRSAIIYNDLLRFKKLDKKYEAVVEGDKIHVINLKQNPYKVNVIALPNSKIPPEIEEFVNEYIDIDHIFESSILNKLKELYSDLNFDFPSLNEKVNRFFKWD